MPGPMVNDTVLSFAFASISCGIGSGVSNPAACVNLPERVRMATLVTVVAPRKYRRVNIGLLQIPGTLKRHLDTRVDLHQEGPVTVVGRTAEVPESLL